MKQNYAKIISGFILAGLLTFSSCQSTHEMAKTDYQIAKVEGRMIDIDAKWDTHPDADAVAILKPYKEKIDNMMYEVIGSSEQKMDKGHPESLLSNLVAEVLRQAATKVQDKPADMGLVNMGGLRNILPAGDITVGTVYKILPFENSLCVMKMKGTHLKALLTSIASLKGEGVSGIRMEITKDGKLLNATVGGQPIDDNKLYTVATIDYLAAGVMIGKRLGRKEYNEAYAESKKIMYAGLFGGVAVSALLILLAGAYTGLYRVDDSVKELGKTLLIVFALYAPVKVENMILGGGIIRSGGNTKTIMIIDIIGTWCIGIPLCLLAAYVFKWGIVGVYTLLTTEELFRLAVSLIIFKRRNWIVSLC